MFVFLNCKKYYIYVFIIFEDIFIKDIFFFFLVIVNNIIYVIENSRRIIMVLFFNYVESEWC